MNCGSLLILKVSTRWGLSPNAFQIRPTVDFDNPDSLAIDARDQCVASAGWRSRVATTTCLDLLVVDRARSTRTRLVGQPVESTLQQTVAATCTPSAATPQLGGDLLVGFTCRTTQHDPTPLRQRLRGLRPPRPPLQRLALLVGQHHRSHRPAPFRHPPSLQLISQFLAQDTRSVLNKWVLGRGPPGKW